MEINGKNDPQEWGVKRAENRQIEKVEIPPEANSLTIEGWDMNNSQQQAYIRAVNRHLIKTVDTEKEEDKENHGIIGCGIYYPWITQTDQWEEALQKAEAATGYRASWRWIMDSGDPAEPGEKIRAEPGRYDDIATPRQKAYKARMPYVPKSGHKSPERERWEAEREQRFEETLKRQQEMFAAIYGK